LKPRYSDAILEIRRCSEHSQRSGICQPRDVSRGARKCGDSSGKSVVTCDGGHRDSQMDLNNDPQLGPKGRGACAENMDCSAGIAHFAALEAGRALLQIPAGGGEAPLPDSLDYKLAQREDI
jgi:hypothetical protein